MCWDKYPKSSRNMGKIPQIIQSSWITHDTRRSFSATPRDRGKGTANNCNNQIMSKMSNDNSN